MLLYFHLLLLKVLLSDTTISTSLGKADFSTSFLQHVACSFYSLPRKCLLSLVPGAAALLASPTFSGCPPSVGKSKCLLWGSLPNGAQAEGGSPTTQGTSWVCYLPSFQQLQPSVCSVWFFNAHIVTGSSNTNLEEAPGTIMRAIAARKDREN